MPFDPACAGKSYPAETVRASWESIARFIQALQEDNPHHIDPKRRGGVVAPPLYAMSLALPLFGRAIHDPALGVPPEALVPVGCDFQAARPVRPGRDVVLTASFGEIESSPEGETITLRLQGTRRLGVLLFIAELRLLHPAAPEKIAPPPPATHFLRPPLAFRAPYTAASPALLGGKVSAASPGPPPDRLLAPWLGLGYAARAVVDTSLKRDPTQLRRAHARPVRDVETGESLTVAGWIMETRRGTTFMGFEILDEEGGLVMSDGVAEVVLK